MTIDYLIPDLVLKYSSENMTINLIRVPMTTSAAEPERSKEEWLSIFYYLFT
jgi:hypothetical protein